MPRYGDLDALKSEFEWLFSEVSESSKDEIRDVIKRIDNAPTVDAVEVVRCKYCKHVKFGKGYFGFYSFCTNNVSGLTQLKNCEKDFCSYGERGNDG